MQKPVKNLNRRQTEEVINRQRRIVLAGMAAVAGMGLASVPGVALAQHYPPGPITMIVPFPPGGGTDAASRVIGQAIAQSTGWNIIIENRPGAGGNIGLAMLARAKPDGLTIGMGQTSNLAINPTLYPKMPYDSIKDFAPIALVAGQPLILVVSAGSSYKSLKDLVQAAKAKSGSLNMASPGIGTVGHLAGVMFGQMAGVTFLHVPYSGAAPALSNLAGGQVDLYFGTPSSVLPLIGAGKLRALAVTSPHRLPAAQDVPTVAESGYPGFDAEDWKGLVAPAGTPDAIIQQLNTAVNAGLKQPATLARLAADGSSALGGTSQHFVEFLKTENERWGQTVRSAGAKVE